MKKFFGEFKKFITRGNVMDMAVGVIVGSAFTAIVNALSNNILKPVINWILAKLFGAGAVKDMTSIDLVVDIVPWDSSEEACIDRLGLEEHTYDLLGVNLPLNTIPVTPGRNLAVILEVAAMNNRQRRTGYNAAVEFTEQISNHLMQSV